MKFTKQNIERIFDKFMQGGDSLADLKGQILNLADTPEKVVVPKFVADWYESQTPISGNDVFRIIQDVIKLSNEEHTWGDYDIDVDIVHYAKNNEEAFLHLLVNCKHKEGYEVEKEPLYYVALPKLGDSDFCYLWTDTDGAVYTQARKGLCIGRLKHTESEIKAIDERYWPFAIEVEQDD